MSTLPMARLGSAVSVIMGQAPAAADCNKDGLGTPFVKVGEFGPERPVVREWTTDPKKLARHTDVLICVVGATCGKINLGIDCAIGRSAAAIRPKPERLDQRYLWYFMQGKVSEMRSGSQGAAQTVISREMITDVKIPLPPVEEQQRIVAVLDEASAMIGTATANAEKNLANARELLRSAVGLAFSVDTESWEKTTLGELCRIARGGSPRPIQSYLTNNPDGINWIKIGDATAGDGKYITSTREKIRPEGLKMSRLVKPGDFLLSNSMSFGRPYIMRTTGCIHDGWLVLSDRSHRYNADFLYYFLSSDAAYRQFDAMAAGSTVRNLNADLVKKVKIAVPSREKQARIVDRLDAVMSQVTDLAAVNEAKLAELSILKQSILHRAFAGALKSQEAAAVLLNDNFATPDFSAKVVAFAYERHVAKNRVRNFGTVKAEKILHMVEAIGGIDLGRQPVREAAGPDDAKHRHATWDWARSQHFFRFNKRSSGGHNFEKLSSYSRMIEDARAAIAGTAVEKAIELLVDMDRDLAELIATTYAAWNNLIIDQCAVTDDDIVLAARDNWHGDKLRFDPSRFHDAIRFLRNNSVVPDGTAKRVGGQEALLI